MAHEVAQTEPRRLPHFLRPISEAPRDGSLVVLYWEDPDECPVVALNGYVVGYWSDVHADWHEDGPDGQWFAYPPTHFADRPVVFLPIESRQADG